MTQVREPAGVNYSLCCFLVLTLFNEKAFKHMSSLQYRGAVQKKLYHLTVVKLTSYLNAVLGDTVFALGNLVTF